MTILAIEVGNLIKPLCPAFGKTYDVFAAGANALGLGGLAIVLGLVLMLILAVSAFSMGFGSFIANLPGILVTILISLAIVNLLLGVFLRYVVGEVTYTCDLDNVPFTWVEEVGEMSLAWLTLLGAGIGIRARSHFTLHFVTPMLAPSVVRGLDILNHLMIAGVGALATWYGIGLVKLNMGLESPGLGISVAYLYASSVIGGALIVVYAISMIFAPPPHDPDAIH